MLIEIAFSGHTVLKLFVHVELYLSEISGQIIYTVEWNSFNVAYSTSQKVNNISFENQIW